MENTATTPTRAADPNPQYNDGQVILNALMPTVETVDGIQVRGQVQKAILKAVMIRTVGSVQTKSESPEPFSNALARIHRGFSGSINITGFGEMANVVASLEAGKVYSFVGDYNSRGDRQFFKVDRIVTMGNRVVAPPVEAPKAKAKKAKKAVAPPVDDAPVSADAPVF